MSLTGEWGAARLRTMHDAPSTAPQVSDELVAAIATDADVDRRTVVRRLAGLNVRGRSGARVDRVLVARGLRTATQPPPAMAATH